ncbi:MAG: hypothetical protein WCB04_07880 [Mycobacteriales bacterium]
MSSSSQTWTVLVFSDDAAVRERIQLAIGRRPAGDVGRIDYVEAATEAEVLAAVDAGGIDVCVLDGEAWPTGGLGVSRQLKNEISPAPVTAVLVARHADRWLAAWSQCDAVLSHPLDPIEAASTIADLLRGLATRVPTGR